MANPLTRLMNFSAETLRIVGTAMTGVMPALRSPDGTYGTQRMQSEQRDAERRHNYPQD
jgi:hypothetical protein